MLSHICLLLAAVRSVTAAHASFACRDDDFYDVGCVVRSQTSDAPPVIGIMVYGAADTPEAANAGAGPGEGTAACILVKADVYANILPADLIAVRPFVACKDLDNPGIALNGAGGKGGLYFPDTGVGTDFNGPSSLFMAPSPPGETLGQTCNRVASSLLTAAQGMNGVDGSASTGLPFLGTCPRLGGYLGRGGTAAGYAKFKAKDDALRGIKRGDTCSSIKAAYKSSECCGADKTKATEYAVTKVEPPAAGPQYIKYTHVTDVMMGASTTIKPYMKLKSATCGYADLMGAVFSDPDILSEVPVFYTFLANPRAYITDTAMTGPEACERHCAADPTCEMFYYQYEFTNSSTMVPVGAKARWMHKCQLVLPFSGSDCGSAFADDANDKEEYAGRVSAAGTK